MQTSSRIPALEAIILERSHGGWDFYNLNIEQIEFESETKTRTLENPFISENDTFFMQIEDDKWIYHYDFEGDHYYGDVFQFCGLLHKVDVELTPHLIYSILMRDIMNHVEGFVSAIELLALDIAEIPCLVKPLLPLTGLAAVVGTSDSGKSCFCRQLAIAICNKEPEFLGFKLTPIHGRVLFVSSEDDAIATASLLKRQVGAMKVTDQNMSNMVFLFDTKKVLQKLDVELTNHQADLVICDSYGDLFDRGDSNSNVQVRQFLDGYSNLAKKHKCLVLFINHIGKRTDGSGPSKHSVIGSQGFEAKMRVVLDIRPDEQGHRLLSPVKGNYLAHDTKKASFVLLFEETTLNFTMTEERVSHSGIGKNSTDKKAYKVDWTTVFAEEIELQRKTLINRLHQIYDMPYGTANTYITDQLEKVTDKPGFWRIPESESQQDDFDEPNEHVEPNDTVDIIPPVEIVEQIELEETDEPKDYV